MEVKLNRRLISFFLFCGNLETSVVGIRYLMPAPEVFVYNSSMSKYMALVYLLSSFLSESKR